jgi:hypothetical protein
MPRKKATPRVREAHAAYAAEAPALEPVPAVEAQDGEDTTCVSERDWEILTGLVENPPPPNEALLRTLRHHHDVVRSFDHADED